MTLKTFKIIPTLGLKNDVPIDNNSLFEFISEGVAKTHDVGGVNVSYARKRGAATKGLGYVRHDTTAASGTTTGCQGMFELKNGGNTDHLYWDHGRMYYLVERVITLDSAPVSFSATTSDLITAVQAGEYVIFTDMGNATPWMWKNGDTTPNKFVGGSGANTTEYTFKYIESFQRRLFGAYDTLAASDGEFSVRWSSAWPTLAIDHANMGFPAANQLYTPNDDVITGIKRMGGDKCFVYCEDSIHALMYYPDYETVFGMKNVIEGQGCTGQHSIISIGKRHFLYNKNYGFCEFRGDVFPYGKPISDDIEADILSINEASANRIVGKYIPQTRELCWTVPVDNITCNKLLFYSLETQQWRKEDKAMSFIDVWTTSGGYTWSDFVSAIGGTSIWSDSSTASWNEFVATEGGLVMSPKDGKIYYHSSEGLDGAALDGYRIEPAMSFGDPARIDHLQEIWFNVGYSNSGKSIDVEWRGGDTVGEISEANWESLSTIPLTNPSTITTMPVIRDQFKTARLHQIKWGSNAADEKWEVSDITFKYTSGGNI